LGAGERAFDVFVLTLSEGGAGGAPNEHPMATDGLPDDVRSLIAQHVDSVLELEVLLAIRSWGVPVGAGELAHTLHLNGDASAAALAKFVRAGLVSRDGEAYSFEPRDAPLRAAVDSLADTYASRRVRVIRFIYGRPNDAVSAFADAFKFRKDR
jgi:hypothetical protein